MRVQDLAAREGISLQRAATLARQGRIPGARKVGREWIIPDEAVVERRAGRPLSAQSRRDFLGFLDTGTLDHVSGSRKRRAAERARQFLSSDDPTKLLRDWWGNDNSEGRGGAALVRAAQLGNTMQVVDAQRGQGAWWLDTAGLIAARISDYRAIRGLSVEELAEKAEVSPGVVSQLERAGVTRTSNRDAVRVAKALAIPFVYLNAVESTHD